MKSARRSLLAARAVRPARPCPARGHVQRRSTQDHSQHQTAASGTANGTPASPFPEPTAEERAAAFPDLGGMDMSDAHAGRPVVARCASTSWNGNAGRCALGWNLRAGIGRTSTSSGCAARAKSRDGGDAHGDAELLWSHATGPWWDRVVGVRSDFGDGPSRQWLALGVVGLAPYKFEVEATGLPRRIRPPGRPARGRIRNPADQPVDPAAASWKPTCTAGTMSRTASARA